MLESELFTMLERTADAAFIISDDGEIHSWNKAAERLFGFPAEEVRNKTCFEVLQALVLSARTSATKDAA
jgi:PAS domain S-box-containing protein